MCIEELKANLEKIALRKSTPYCHLCQADAPTGFCRFCHTNKLMRRYDGSVEWGTGHVIDELIEEHLEPIDCEEHFEESMQDCYDDEVKVGWLNLNPVDVIKNSHTTDCRMALNEYFDDLEEKGQVVSFGRSCRYYWTHEVTQFVKTNLDEETGGT